jgi:FkbM family methyltransferase
MSIVHARYERPPDADLQRLYRELESSYFGDDPQERDEQDRFKRLVAGAKIFVDIGASLGQYTSLADTIMTGGEIISVEADPTRFHRLVELCRAWENDRSRNRLTPHLAAVCDRDGTTPFFIANANVSGGLYLQRETESLPNDYAWQEIDIPCITLDTLLGDKVPDLVKIDVEGAECRVLEGARGLVAKRKTLFFIEVHPWGDAAYHKRPRDVFRFFMSNGYTFQRLGRRWLFKPGRLGAVQWLYGLVFIPIADFVLRHASIRRLAKKLLADR